MLNLSGESLSLVALDDVNDVDISKGLMDISWNSLVDLLKVHDIRQSKEGPCFIPAQFKDSGEWVLSENDKVPSYRNDLNVDSISVAVLDLDELGSKEKAESIFKDFEHVIYSTHSYTKDKPYKYRIVLRLDSPIQGIDWPHHFKSLIASIDADRSCGNLSRVFYFPSHSPNAGIKPYFHHHDGRNLTIDDINNIRKDFENGLSPEELQEFRKKNTPVDPRSSVRTHFTGEKRSVYDTKNMTIDYSYQGMKETFSKFIPDLVDNDNRHDFALKVCGSAVSKWGSKVDFFNVVQFIYKASTEYGSKSLLDPSGDTRKEIPEMISSAVSKYAPDLITGDEPVYSDLRSSIRDIVSKVEAIAITGSWDFPIDKISFSDKDDVYRKLDIRLNNGIDYSKDAMRTRNYDLIREFVNNPRVVPFSNKVFEKEFSLNGERTNINLVSQFLFYCIDGYSRRVLVNKDISNALSVAKKILLDNALDVLPSGLNSEQCQKFFSSSIQIAEKRALNGSLRWGFSHNSADKKPSSDMAIKSNEKEGSSVAKEGNENRGDSKDYRYQDYGSEMTV